MIGRRNITNENWKRQSTETEISYAGNLKLMVKEAEMRERQTGVYEKDKGSKGRATHHLSLTLNPRHTLHDDICKGSSVPCTSSGDRQPPQ